jgi:hypothetical protein
MLMVSRNSKASYLDLGAVWLSAEVYKDFQIQSSKATPSFGHGRLLPHQQPAMIHSLGTVY